MTFKQVYVSSAKKHFVLVPREKMRFRLHGRDFGIPGYLPGLAKMAPVAPKVFSGSQNRKTKYPILGNDQEGDCYMADALHCIQTWTGWNGPEAQFDVSSVLALYEQLSGGDNGLGDDQIFPAWEQGLFGHRILDEMTVDPSRTDLVCAGIYFFTGCSWTCSLLDTWLANPQPGQLWDAGGTPDPNAGHAMHLSGYDMTGTSDAPQGFFEDETWAIDPPIRLTPAGMQAAAPEVTVQFSLDAFDAQGINPANGMTYYESAALWKACGGINLPPWGGTPIPPPGPGPTPPPTPGPTPPAGAGYTGCLCYQGGLLTDTMVMPAMAQYGKSAGITWQQVLDLIGMDLLAGKGWPAILADIAALINPPVSAAKK